MLISGGTYLKPGKETRVLAILDALTRNSGISQYDLGKQLNLSGAMVNQYLKKLQEKNLLAFTPVNGKSFRYELTEAGEAARRQYFSDYAVETIQFYSAIKRFLQERLAPLTESGVRRLVLFGASETCEVVLSALQDTEFQILALLDNDKDKQGKRFHGHMICSPLVLEQMDPDATVITSFGKQEEIYQQLKPLSEKKGFAIVRF